MIAPPLPEQETESGYALAVETATVIDRHETAEDTNEKVSAVVALELYARQVPRCSSAAIVQQH